ncbi:hypothetical protein BH11ACT7_BH11ACT7_16530 [soil metagenome]
MVTVLVAITIVPSAPVLVPALAGAAAAELADLREAVLEAAATLPDRWIAIGTGPADTSWSPDSAGTFAGFGVDVAVALSPRAAQNATLPLPGLIAGWLRGQVRPTAHVQVRTFAATQSSGSALDLGREMRATIDADRDPVGVLVVADGCNTLTPSAPGGHDPESLAVQAVVDDALATGDTTALAASPDSVGGRVPFAVLAGLAAPGPHAAKELYRGAPFGVGYAVDIWQP